MYSQNVTENNKFQSLERLKCRPTYHIWSVPLSTVLSNILTPTKEIWLKTKKRQWIRGGSCSVSLTCLKCCLCSSNSSLSRSVSSLQGTVRLGCVSPKILFMGTWIRIHLAVLDPDPDWECGSGCRSMEIDPGFLPFSMAFVPSKLCFLTYNLV